LIICEKIKVLKLKLAEKKILKNIKKIGKKRKKKIRLDDYNLSLENIKNEVKKQKKKDRKIEFARMSTYYNLIIIAVTIILVTRIFNVIQISGNSMEPSLYSGNFLISTKMFGYKKGDIIAFYYNNSILVKRVIATEGDIVNIDDDGNVYVNSEKIEEDYVEKLSYGNCNITFPYKIQDKQIFVLGDNRENSIDSRNKDIGSISEDKILGKIIMNISQLLFY
jgi:signal peptidase I